MTEIGTQLREYRILRRIGAGGMAEVFLAEKIGAAGFARQVAIKTIVAAGSQPEAIGLFLDEARVASSIHHNGIVQTLDLGFENDTLFIVMEYVQGPPLSRIIHELKIRNRFLPGPLVAYIGAKMASALDFAHRRVTDAGTGKPLNLVHRDVSPQNILLDRSGNVKLTDFGVARASSQAHHTRTGQVRGKAAYMAPEQVRAKALDGRTDLFALGVVMYEALTAHRPFFRTSDIESMKAVLRSSVPPISSFNPAVPDDLCKVVMQALEKKADDRHPDCGELEAALNKTLRKHREAEIAAQLGGLVNELFGEQQTLSDGRATEGWQPTIAISADGSVTPQLPKALPAESLTPEMAALLKHPEYPTPMTPRSKQLASTPSSEVITGEAAPGALDDQTRQLNARRSGDEDHASQSGQRSDPTALRTVVPQGHSPSRELSSTRETPMLSPIAVSVREQSAHRANVVSIAALVAVSLALAGAIALLAGQQRPVVSGIVPSAPSERPIGATAVVDGPAPTVAPRPELPPEPALSKDREPVSTEPRWLRRTRSKALPEASSGAPEALPVASRLRPPDPLETPEPPVSAEDLQSSHLRRLKRLLDAPSNDKGTRDKLMALMAKIGEGGELKSAEIDWVGTLESQRRTH